MILHTQVYKWSKPSFVELLYFQLRVKIKEDFVEETFPLEMNDRSTSMNGNLGRVIVLIHGIAIILR